MPFFNWNDHKLFYRKQGKGPLLLILPGDTASSKCHQSELDHFSDRFCAASLDFLGTGKSERIKVWARNWWDQAASQAADLVEELGYKDCIAMGTSGGGLAALIMAILFPEKVRAVIADSCVSKITKKEAHKLIFEDRAKKTIEQKRFWEFAHGPDWEQVVDADTARLMSFVDGGGDWFSGRLAEIQCPVLITASKQDPTFPRIARKVSLMSEQITDCQIFLNNKGDHPLMWTAPQDFRMVSDYFLEKLISRQG